MTYLNNLNKGQKQAVLTTDGPVMILAGAGSGKTRTLVSRISYLLDKVQVSSHQLLALTFSNKAAKEMRERISRELDLDLGSLQVTTFHSFCAKLLRSEANYLGLSRNFTIYDTSETKAVIKSLLAKRGISSKELPPSEVLYYIDDLKNNGYYKDSNMELDYEVDTEDEYYEYYLEYEQELRRANAVDFGGLITGVLELFEKFPKVMNHYQERYKYILVDEYQDTNRCQFHLLKNLSEKTKNICVVGDEDQSIYSWRGADIRNILDFEETYPHAKILKLEQNYRSSKTIIEAASCVIERNSHRKGKKMWTDNSEGNSISIVECPNEQGEAEFVTTKIIEHAEKGIHLSDVAIFYRTNSQSRVIEDSLRKNNIPYRVVGGMRFYERKEIKDLLCYLRILVNEKDSLALARIINVPTRGIGATSLRKIEEKAVEENVSLWEMVELIVEKPENYSYLRLSSKIRSSLSEFANLIWECKTLDSNKEKPSVIFEKLLYESGYIESLKVTKNYEDQARIENLEELGSAIKQFEESASNPNILNFLETVTLDTNVESDEDQTQAMKGEVSLMTIHGAKGLEFPLVFITGAEENIFPSFRSLEEGEMASEEERRLFYVAMTRAMKELFIVFAQGRMLYGQLKFNGPSRFIYEIPDKFYEWIKIGKFGQSYSDDFEESQDYYDPDEVVYQVGEERQVERPKSKFPKGKRVLHALYGEGKIISNDGLGNEEKVVIKFQDGVKKKFMVKFAPLTLL
ncbi:MAG: ATP-dependent helicase [Bacteriovoracaceae bacterium]